MDSGADPSLSPTVFLVEQPPGSILPTHFHRQNQFQVIVSGSGMIGRHPLRPVAVHYAGAYTGYGPLTAGPEGLSYFTIRAVYERGANFLPNPQHPMVKGPKRQVHCPPIDTLKPGRLVRLRGTLCHELLNGQTDNLRVTAYAVPPGGTLSLPPPGGGGQFQLVLAGTASAGSTCLSRWECRYVHTAIAAPDLLAGDDGVQMLVLQMPVKDSAYR